MTGEWVGTIGPDDVHVARLVLDTWLEDLDGVDVAPGASDFLELRGRIAQTVSDVRTAAYLEGAMRGRKDTARLVLDALAAEGL